MGHDLASAAAIVVNTAEAARAVCGEFPHLTGRPVRAMPNGFDPADFCGPEPARSGGRRFRIVHAGYLHTALGEGGARSAAQAPRRLDRRR